ncbi:diacylglycerol kinase [Bifidobacterium sp. CP2]|uniref:diacylglycerol/lipid kinase family protein n=1 Tax=Bifidobacterium sp. CP2 TaxID=2809025 RepID=UPI001BDD019B|nr:diacylglycerol kinase family protein [Bifidobacterium sp. CP2]MBT1182357.1 diacylglycerol kinase [Bifidobacterium sp. CP2]
MQHKEQRTVVAMVGNPVSGKGKGASFGRRVASLLEESGSRYGFETIDLTGASFDDSLANARMRIDDYDYLVTVGGDGMIALGVNAVGGSGKPLGIVAVGSGNDFARGLRLPVNAIGTAVEGIVGAIVRGSYVDVDLGRVTALDGARRADPTSGNPNPSASSQSGRAVDGDAPAFDRYYAGMLNCGLDASINDRANHSRLPGGSLRYFAAVLHEVTDLKRYGYHVKATLADGSVEERDIISPMITVANARYIGGGLEVSPYSRLDDGLLDLVWIDHMPGPLEIADAISKGYNGRLLGSRVFGWKRVRDVEVTRAAEGDEPPVLMADGEYVGTLPVRVRADGLSLRVLVPPAVAAWQREQRGRHGEEQVLEALSRDGRDPVTGEFL